MPSHMAWEMWGAESKWKGWADFATDCGSRIERSKAWNQSLVEQYTVYGPLHQLQISHHDRDITVRTLTTSMRARLSWMQFWTFKTPVLGILVTDIQFQMCSDVLVVWELWEVTMPDTGGPYYLSWNAKRNNSIVLWPKAERGKQGVTGLNPAGCFRA